MSKENNNNKNVDPSLKENEFKCDSRPKESEETSISTGSNNNDGTSEQTRREETPFSLKHFLKRDSNNEHQNQMTGVRPKIPTNAAANSDTIKMKRSPKFSSFDSQASLASSLPKPSDVTNIGSNSFQSNRCFNINSDSENMIQKNTPIQRSCSAYDQRPVSFLDSDKNTDMLSDAFRDLFPNLMKNSNSEHPSALPDFVQDHLLMEQFYYKDTDRSPIVSPPLSSSYAHQYDHQMPDFTLNENDSGRNYSNNGDMPFDLMCNSNESNRSSSNRNPLILPLDLPIDLPINSGHNRSQMSHQMHNNYQLDLTARTDGFPPSIDNLGSNRNSHMPGGVGHSGGGDNFQTLPDFLSDGHVHSTGRQSDILQETSPELELPGDYMPRTKIEMRADIMRLRRELKSRNQIISEQNRRIAELEVTLANVRSDESIVQNMEEIAGNINRSDQRAAAAMTLADDYKKQILQLSTQIEELRQENEILKEEGAVGGSNIHSYHTRPILHSQQISKELLVAASTAETNLRQLLNGVENLRLLARKIDSIDEVQPRNDYSDCEDDDFAAGPAL